jgi:hypothetical protein
MLNLFKKDVNKYSYTVNMAVSRTQRQCVAICSIPFLIFILFVVIETIGILVGKKRPESANDLKAECPDKPKQLELLENPGQYSGYYANILCT